jgi:tetratricopeptide (TPR) repeat protein
VHSLVDKSFVRPVAGARFDLLTSVQEYAAEHLRTPGRFAGSGPPALAAAQARHRAYFAALDEDRADADRGAELANFVVACRRAVSSVQAEDAISLVERAWAALRLRGPFRIGLELATLALGMPRLDAGRRGRAAYVAARALESSGMQAEAKPHFEAALALSREAGSALGTARALLGLAAIHASEGHDDAATLAGGEALALGEALCNTALQCETRNLMGNLFLELRGDPHQALSHYEAGLAVARACGNRRWEGGLLGNVGNVRFSLGQVEEAREDYAAALQAARDVGDRKFEGNMLSNLGWLHLTQGHPEEGRQLFEPALEIARELGHAHLESTVLCNLALACEGIGRPDDAQHHYAAALAIAQRAHDRRSEGQILGYLGGLRATQGRFDAARADFARGAALLQEVADRFSLGVLLCRQATAEHVAGDSPAARAALERARVIAREVSAGDDSELGLELQRVAELLGR